MFRVSDLPMPDLTAANLVCDLDGVVYRGNTVIPGSGAALNTLESAGFRIIFATNNSSRTEEQVAEKIRDVSGFDASRDQVVTSAQAAASLLGSDPERVVVVGGEGLSRALEERGHQIVVDGDAATAVAVGFDPNLTYERLKQATRALHRGARFIASNLDSTFPGPNNDLWPGAGSMVAALETSSGRRAEPAGKPFEPMRALIAEKLSDGPVFVVGDRPDTDLELGRSSGWLTVLTLSGVTHPDHVGEIEADFIVDRLADLPGILNVA